MSQPPWRPRVGGPADQGTADPPWLRAVAHANLGGQTEPRGRIMSDGSTLSLAEIEDRIAILRDNIRQLTEQAAGSSGAADEERTADRIADQEAQLQRLLDQRDAITKPA
jgi:uncharacterized small protein (DUF1192 family)